ncbi:MAG: ECF transporter S component [Candidatus Bathyarchaeota archaeon]|nr:MAG: ECF transporter S component [Candidatus Bathyarchaeota archaeon]
MKPLDVAATAINAALYAVFGYIFFFIIPITTPGLGLVRFWPVVIIPAVFAVLFGPWVGGVGGAIGIFISDMLIHGNPILSLMAGVTSNFALFFLIGYISRRNINWKVLTALFGLWSLLFIFISYTWLEFEVTMWFTGVIVVSYIILLLFVALVPRWRSFEIASMIGLITGSAIIGATVWLFSQYFIMPGGTGVAPLPVYASLTWLVWTFATEIPFLLGLGPPILEACYKAFPSLAPKLEE